MLETKKFSKSVPDTFLHLFNQTEFKLSPNVLTDAKVVQTFS